MKARMNEKKDPKVNNHKQKCSKFTQMEMVYVVIENFLISKGES